jgi:hypothetical protein
MGFPNLTAAIEAWGDERVHYNYNKPGFSEETGHFTQLVWKSTRTVGCDRHDCGIGQNNGQDARGWFVVCQYWPPGNVVDDNMFRDNVQRQTTASAGGAPGGGVPARRRLCETYVVAVALGAVVGPMAGWA